MEDEQDAARGILSFDTRTLGVGSFLRLFPIGYMLFWLVLLLVIYLYQGPFPGIGDRTEGWAVFSVIFLISAGLAWAIAIFSSLTLMYDVGPAGIVMRRFCRRPISMRWEEVDSVSYRLEEYWSVFTLRGAGRQLELISEVQEMTYIAEIALARIPREKWVDPKFSLVTMMRFAGRIPPLDLVQNDGPR